MVLTLWKVIGLVAGLLAGWNMPGSKPSVLLITTILGMAGASVGSSPRGLTRRAHRRDWVDRAQHMVDRNCIVRSHRAAFPPQPNLPPSRLGRSGGARSLWRYG